MLDLGLTFSFLSFITVISIFAYYYFQLKSSDIENESDKLDENEGNSNVDITNGNSNTIRIGNRVIRNRISRINQQRESNRNELISNRENNDNINADGDNDETNTPTIQFGKIGKKKRLKLEMKAEKRTAREIEANRREELRIQKEKEDEIQRKIEEELELKEKQKEEEELRLKEEEKRIKHEEYLKVKKSFIVEEEGFEGDTDSQDQKNKLDEFINYIKEKKIVLLEELASEFKMKTQDVITRIKELLILEQIEGVIDDRGKFIYITQDELNSVCKFIKQRGRVSIVELVEKSNTLIQT